MAGGRPPKKPVYIDSEGLRYFLCSKCGTPKSEFEFATSSRSANGITSWCKFCLAEVYSDNYERRKRARKALEERVAELERQLAATQPESDSLG